MNCYKIKFEGQILERGFWIYVWRICHRSSLYLYVGRTGDNSSRFAASPFNRIGKHLDMRETAKSNSLMRQIKRLKIDPLRCRFEMYAVGPLFMEQKNMQKHRPFRDSTAAIESAVAEKLKVRGYNVLGKHPPKKPVDEKLLNESWQKIVAFFPFLKE